MEDQMPITKSLHRLCVENPRFLVRPLFWTPKHLQVLHCRIHHLDSAALPPSPPFWPSSDADPDDAEHYMKHLRSSRFACDKFASFSLMMRAHGLDGIGVRPPFFYNKLELHTPECKRLIIGHFLYEELVKQRRRSLKPRRHPVDGASNVPGDRIYQRRLRELTPALWFEDPYLVRVLLSLAQFQRRSRKMTPEAFFVRLLVTYETDQANPHVLRADIPSSLLHALDNPTDAMDNFVWPAIQHVQVPFAPHATFSERAARQLLAGIKTEPSEEEPRGEKRKRDELDAE
ncbi:hypothetical protein NW766_009593 [Fusarium irregulare]|uniref:Uncharacterized protein n=1 Tax=Fusarium irregulare TaxID=2494466 RepID=A0A9W8PIC6_9HYPO|nr:hypothetical protein NW766_009593 [Fusarium irregulare]